MRVCVAEGRHQHLELAARRDESLLGVVVLQRVAQQRVVAHLAQLHDLRQGSTAVQQCSSTAVWQYSSAEIQ